MGNTILFENAEHKNVLIEDFAPPGAAAIQANQHLIIHKKAGMILDPGGHKIYSKVMAATMALLGGGAQLKYLFFSHQDPDIVAAANGWLMTTNAMGYVSQLWTRFVPHFGLDRLVTDRLLGIPDEGMRLDLDGCSLMVVPGHFMHSPGMFQIYDPISKILYTGDLGASVGMSEIVVSDFDAHLKFMTGFHQRYMAGNRVLRAWAKMVRGLDIDIIAPQHGAMFKGKENVNKFIDWIEKLECGIDRIEHVFKLPA